MMNPMMWLVFGLLLLAVSTTFSKPNKRNKLIYIMIDGFRYDYVDDQGANEIPGFSEFLENGVRAEYMTPIFPSISYPDWTTLVTGLYAESHGIVGNYFYDAEEKDKFSLFDSPSTGRKKWWTAEPIWTTATKMNLRTAVILWSRCDVTFDGVTPDYCEPFVKIPGKEIFKKNIDTALNKLEEGYDFIQVYTEHTDYIGHNFGPETEERKQAVRELDTTISYMLQRIKEMKMEDEVNIIIVSDHGMTTTGPDSVKRVELDDYLLTEHVENIADSGAFSNIKVKEGFVDQVYEKLKGMPGVEVYRKEEIPDSFHFKNNKYIHDIILKANINTLILSSRSEAQMPPRNDNWVSYGGHGYDPMEEKMRTIFFAHGPDFKKGLTIPPIKNVDVYPLLTHLLNVNPNPNNGSWSVIKQALIDSSQPTNAGVSLTTGLGLIWTVAIVILGNF